MIPAQRTKTSVIFKISAVVNKKIQIRVVTYLAQFLSAVKKIETIVNKSISEGYMKDSAF